MGKIDEMWYLRILAVHSGFQRKRFGCILLDWGLNLARKRGEKVYLEASPSGKGLYLKKGFQVVGDLILEDEGKEGISIPCMVWDPALASSRGQLQ